MTAAGARTPEPYDGYVSETQAGYEVSANGRTIRTVTDFSLAKLLLAEHCAGKPRWFVSRTGGYGRID